jgi:hypothetical protein
MRNGRSSSPDDEGQLTRSPLFFQRMFSAVCSNEFCELTLLQT